MSLDIKIRERLVCDINHDTIQKRLLAENDKLTLDKALSLAQVYKTAVKDASHAIILLPKDASS